MTTSDKEMFVKKRVTAWFVLCQMSEINYL